MIDARSRSVNWLFIFLAFQSLGGIVYAIVQILPEWIGGMTARKRTTAAGEPVDPEHDDRLARDLKEDSPTDAKRMKMAGAPGRHEEAQQLNALAAQGI